MFVSAAFFRDGHFHEFNSVRSLYQKRLIEMCEEPLVLKFHVPMEGVVYFAAKQDAFERLNSQGKTVRLLMDLFQAWKDSLVKMGLPQETKIAHWTLYDVHIHEKALKEFAGAELLTVMQ